MMSKTKEDLIKQVKMGVGTGAKIAKRELEYIKKTELSELHNCNKCEGKIVLVSADVLGVTRCGYCGEVVDYTSWMKKKLKEVNNVI